MSGDEREPRRRMAVREALAAKREVDAIVRKRRTRLRWIAATSMLTWLPFGAVAMLANLPDAVYIWAAGAVAATGVTAAIHLAERRARSRLQSAVACVTLDDARELMRELG